jgi:hypothetical protein
MNEQEKKYKGKANWYEPASGRHYVPNWVVKYKVWKKIRAALKRALQKDVS